MPCNCDYLEPNRHEIESKIACQNLRYVLESKGKPVPNPIKNGAVSSYGCTAILVEVTVALCKECKEMTPEEQSKIIYDGRSKKARALAEWWDKYRGQTRRRRLRN